MLKSNYESKFVIETLFRQIFRPWFLQFREAVAAVPPIPYPTQKLGKIENVNFGVHRNKFDQNHVLSGVWWYREQDVTKISGCKIMSKKWFTKN